MSKKVQKTAEKTGSKKPLKNFRARGGINISVWENDGAKGSFLSAKVDKSYLQGDQWKKGGSFSAAQLDGLSEVAQEAATFMRGYSESDDGVEERSE